MLGSFLLEKVIFLLEHGMGAKSTKGFVSVFYQQIFTRNQQRQPLKYFDGFITIGFIHLSFPSQLQHMHFLTLKYENQ